MRSILLAVTLAAMATIAVPAEEVETAVAAPQLHAIWSDVTTAQTEEAQLAAIEAFIAALPMAGGLPAAYVVTARDRRGAPVDFATAALMADPANHIVTLHAEGQTFDFVPLSERTIAVLLRE